jgi:predicted nucleic acid-binding protein
MGVHAIRPVVLDACVLVPQSLCDLLLRLAEDPRLYRPVWSAQILTEAHRALTHKLPKKWTKPQADRWRQAIETAFPEAMNEPAAGILAQARNHPGDRHVLAAAIEAGAQEIVTANLKHFRPEHLEPWKIEAVSPDAFLLQLYSLNPGAVMHKVDLMSRKESTAVTLTLLRKHAPTFVARLEQDMRPAVKPRGGGIS